MVLTSNRYELAERVFQGHHRYIAIMVLLITEVEQMALGAWIVPQKELETCGILASHTVGMFEFKRVNAAGPIENEVNFILGLSAPVED
jgi:hypothetical protein